MAEESYLAALSRGAVGFVSRLISAAVHPFVIINRIRAAYRGMNMQEVSQVYWLGAQAHTAAYEARTDTGPEPPPLADIPINPQIQPEVGPGNRFKYQITGEYKISGETNSRFSSQNIYSPVQLTFADLQAQWDLLFAQVNNITLPGAQGPQPEPVQNLGISRIEFVERWY